ncbi:MAG: hypothetical protein KAW92_03085 [Candidatus Cloacimonetes bacterium]|nr:hypothetical protein [Candidatus Cloacimonadota bacterium]
MKKLIDFDFKFLLALMCYPNPVRNFISFVIPQDKREKRKNNLFKFNIVRLPLRSLSAVILWKAGLSAVILWKAGLSAVILWKAGLSAVSRRFGRKAGYDETRYFFFVFFVGKSF